MTTTDTPATTSPPPTADQSLETYRAAYNAVSEALGTARNAPDEATIAAARDALEAAYAALAAARAADDTFTDADTAAAAYAEAGDMDQAAAWAQKSQEVAPEEQRAEIEQLVKTYQSRRLTRRSTSAAVRNDASQKQ